MMVAIPTRLSRLTRCLRLGLSASVWIWTKSSPAYWRIRRGSGEFRLLDDQKDEIAWIGRTCRMQIDDLARIIAGLHGAAADIDGTRALHPLELRRGNDFAMGMVVD